MDGLTCLKLGRARAPAVHHVPELLILLLLLLPFNGLFPRTTWVSQYQKGKTSLDLNEARDDGVLVELLTFVDHCVFLGVLAFG